MVAQMVKRLSTMRETQVWSLGQEDPLEKEMATHSSTLDWKIPWTEESGRLQSMGSLPIGHNWAISLHFHTVKRCSIMFNNIEQKRWLKLSTQKLKIMASSPITSWQIDGETMETVTDFIFLGSKITVGSDCSLKMKDTCSLEGKEQTSTVY